MENLGLSRQLHLAQNKSDVDAIINVLPNRDHLGVDFESNSHQ